MSDSPPPHAPRQSGAARRKAKRERAAAAERSSEATKGRGQAGSAGPGPARMGGTGGSRGSGGRAAGRPDGAGRGSGGRRPDARRVALEALLRIEEGGAYANLALGPILERSGLDERDRRLATELVYGVTRMRRACDWLIDRFVSRPLDLPTRNALRIGAHQIAHLEMPAHAAVGTAVEVAPARSRGLVNAVLRKVAASHGAGEATFPDLATELSYPDWIVERLIADLGPERGRGALVAMNQGADPTTRADGYTQDRASQWVAELVGAQPGERVADLCAAPGGKATALAAAGASVVAADLRPSRVGLIVGNAERTGVRAAVHPVVADAVSPPLRPAAFDRVLVDAPCTGLGVLHRRADARWRVEPDAVERLADLQVAIVDAAADLVRPGGTLVVSVCTLTAAETTGVDERLAASRPDLRPLPPPGAPWEAVGRGAVLLPQAAGTDGMAIHRYQRE